jgi:prepilin-type N-terminal cleavage/methylation domain-containing protein
MLRIRALHPTVKTVADDTNAAPRRERFRSREDAGFTIIELVISMALLAIIAAPLASVFWAAIRTAGAASHRTDGASIASREIEAMRAVPYAQVGFYADQTNFGTATSDGSTRVSLGSTSPATGKTVPQMQLVTPDPNAASNYAPDPSPTNATPIVLGGVKYSVMRDVVWVDAKDATTTFSQAYKRLSVDVTWTDQAGSHKVHQDSLLYPGNLGAYVGAMGGSGSTTTTTAPVFAPSQPVLAAITLLGNAQDETQLALSWSQPSGGAAVTSYSIEYSTNPSFPPGNFTLVAGLASSITNYTVTSLAPNTTYYFEIVSYAGANPSTPSQWQSLTTAPLPGPVCTLGGLNVAGATSLSTTGSILQNNGKMSENLTLSWSTTGPCLDTYQATGTDPTGAADPSSPYTFSGSSGAYNTTVFSFGSKSWAIGLHTFRVFDVTTNKATPVVKTFKVCVNGASSC